MNQVDSSGGQITLIHFTHEVAAMAARAGAGSTPPSPDLWRIACMPGMTEFHATGYHPHYQRSNDTRAVTCPACKRSAVYLECKGILETNMKGPIRAR